jgi:hypothetical protein
LKILTLTWLKHHLFGGRREHYTWLFQLHSILEEINVHMRRNKGFPSDQSYKASAFEPPHFLNVPPGSLTRAKRINKGFPSNQLQMGRSHRRFEKPTGNSAPLPYTNWQRVQRTGSETWDPSRSLSSSSSSDAALLLQYYFRCGRRGISKKPCSSELPHSRPNPPATAKQSRLLLLLLRLRSGRRRARVEPASVNSAEAPPVSLPDQEEDVARWRERWFVGPASRALGGRRGVLLRRRGAAVRAWDAVLHTAGLAAPACRPVARGRRSIVVLGCVIFLSFFNLVVRFLILRAPKGTTSCYRRSGDLRACKLPFSRRRVYTNKFMVSAFHFHPAVIGNVIYYFTSTTTRF